MWEGNTATSEAWQSCKHSFPHVHTHTLSVSVYNLISPVSPGYPLPEPETGPRKVPPGGMNQALKNYKFFGEKDVTCPHCSRPVLIYHQLSALLMGLRCRPITDVHGYHYTCGGSVHVDIGVLIWRSLSMNITHTHTHTHSLC